MTDPSAFPELDGTTLTYWGESRYTRQIPSDATMVFFGKLFYCSPCTNHSPLIEPRFLYGQGQIRLPRKCLVGVFMLYFVFVKQQGCALKLVDEKLRSDMNIVREAVENDPLALQFVSDGLKDEPWLVYSALGRNGLMLEFVAETRKNDHSIVLRAVNNNLEALKFASQSIQEDQADIMKKSLPR